MAAQVRAGAGADSLNSGLDYNQIATSYASHRRASPAVVSHVAGRLGNLAIESILELGCGTANYLLALTSELGVHGTGFDRSAGMLLRHTPESSRIRLLQADAQQILPFGDAAFDLAFSVDVIHYIPELISFFERVKRVLTPGGTVLTITDSEQDIRNRTMARYFPEIVPVEIERYHSIDRIEEAMQSAGIISTAVSHVERRIDLDPIMIEKFRNKAYSALRLIPESAFQRGMARLEKDACNGPLTGVEVYTCVWGFLQESG